MSDAIRRYRQAAIAFLLYTVLALISIAVRPPAPGTSTGWTVEMGHGLYILGTLAVALLAPVVAQGQRWRASAWLTRGLTVMVIAHAFALVPQFPRAPWLVLVSLLMLGAGVMLARASFDALWLRQHL